MNAKPFRVYGLTLISDIPLEELASDTGAELEEEPDIRIQLSSRCGAGLPPPRHWFMTWTLPTGEIWLRCAKDAHGYLLHFPDLVDFSVDSAGREIIYAANPETPLETLRHLLLDQVLPLVLNLRGRDALHATAIQTPRGACAFIGPAGAGKSTLAASFLRAGYPVLSDDCLVLQSNSEHILAGPAYPGLRLWPDTFEALRNHTDSSRPVAHYTSKQRLLPGENPKELASACQPLVRIYSVVRATATEVGDALAEPLIERLSCRDGFMELVPSAFRLDITDRTMLARQFRFFGQIVSRVSVRRLHVPNTFSSLPAVREVINADLMNK